MRKSCGARIARNALRNSVIAIRQIDPLSLTASASGEKGGYAMSMYGNTIKELLYTAIESIKDEYENELDFIADLAAILAEYMARDGYGQNGW